MNHKMPLLSFLTGIKTKAPHLVCGENAEQLAERFLINKGLTPVCRNFRCKPGELDLVMTDDKSLVVIEVRFRKSAKYGSALESITGAKQSRIIAATQVYLSKQKQDRPIRFDVIAISADGRIEWIPNAFYSSF
ncbi:MAG TPA: YraN family protein [Methylomicrobium sp.]|nr:YraN family protein [Methylomicrobium sp.]